MESHHWKLLLCRQEHLKAFVGANFSNFFFFFLSDCLVPLFLQRLWDNSVLPAAFHPSPNTDVQEFGEHNSQVQMVCYILSSRLLLSFAFVCIWSVTGRLASPFGCLPSLVCSVYCCDCN